MLQDSSEEETIDDVVPFAWSERVLRDEVVECLRHVIDPDLHKDIVSCGFLKNLSIDAKKGHVSFTLELTTPACPEKAWFEAECYRRIKCLDWVEDIDIEMSASGNDIKKTAAFESGLSNVKEVLLISSCKGGVGKSTLTVNLAFILAQKGLKIGICDVDIYGSNIPTLVPQAQGGVVVKDGFLTPKTIQASMTATSAAAADRGVVGLGYVKLMSAGWLRREYIAMRGPLATDLVTQMVLQTAWDDLDYLLLDMPPGTGDVNLQIAELIPKARFILITTDHPSSYEDTEKGLDMFLKAKLSCVGFIINQTSAHQSMKDAELIDGRWRAREKSTPNSPSWTEVLKSSVPSTFLPHAPELHTANFYPTNSQQPVGPWSLVATLNDRFDCDDSSTVLKVLKSFADSVIRFICEKRFVSMAIPEVKIVGDSSQSIEVIIPLHHDETDITNITAQAARVLCKCKKCISSSLSRRLAPNGLFFDKVLSVDRGSIQVRFSDGHDGLLPVDEILKKSEPRNCGVLADW